MNPFSSLASLADEEESELQFESEWLDSTPKPNCPGKRRQVFSQNVSKRTKRKFACEIEVENLRAAESLSIAVGDELIIRSRKKIIDEAYVFGDFEFSRIEHQISDLHNLCSGQCPTAGIVQPFDH